MQAANTQTKAIIHGTCLSLFDSQPFTRQTPYPFRFGTKQEVEILVGKEWMPITSRQFVYSFSKLSIRLYE